MCVCVFNSNLRKLLLLVTFKAISRHSVYVGTIIDENIDLLIVQALKETTDVFLAKLCEFEVEKKFALYQASVINYS